jgi:hypothetical protein
MTSMSETVISGDDMKIQHPFSMAVCGPSTCGKTYWIYMFMKSMKQIIKTKDIYDFPEKVMYCFSVEQQLYDNMKKELNNILFYKGIPQLEEIYQYFENKSGIVVMDDLMYEIMKNLDMLKLFTQGIHHHNISVIFMTQNIFQQGIHARTIALNVKYLILFYNPRDKAQIKYLGSQIYPGKGKILLEAYLNAVNSKKWGYLLLDLTTNCPENMRMRTNILPNESDVIYVYNPKI